MTTIAARLAWAAALLTPWSLLLAADAPATRPTPESLAKGAVPEWFRDAKLGIFMHWGPESIPGEASTWYARWMYEEGSAGYRFHCATYGHPSKFGYKDICKLFKAPKFDQAQADRLAALYKRAGAGYVVPVAAHHDNFDMWDSKYQPRWNSMATAGKDVVGMWKKAAGKTGLRLGVASHVARTYRWFQTSHGSDKTGPLAGVPYDGQDPQYADLYGAPWPSTDYGYEGPQDVGPPAFEKTFEDRMLDLIDKYHPDLYYTDGGPPFKSAGYRIVAHLYNESQKWHDGRLEAVVNFKGGNAEHKGIGADNFEFEYASTIRPYPWQTDKTMSPEWYWLRNRTKQYRKGPEIVHTLIDVVSKNGNLLLNVPLTGDGDLEDETIAMLNRMAHDFNLIGEAIFATRPWEAFGEGQKGFNNIDHGSASDIRFTRNKASTMLYVTTLGWPGNGAVVRIKTLAKPRIDLATLKSVSLVGAPGELAHVQEDDALEITLPAKVPFECSAYPIRLTFAQEIPKLKPAAALLWQARARDISGPEDRAAYGLRGVLLINAPASSEAAKGGLTAGDVILSCNGAEAGSIRELLALADRAAGAKLVLSVMRRGQPATVELTDYAYLVNERLESPQFQVIPLDPAAIRPVAASLGEARAAKGPVDLVLDGHITRGQGVTFPNGVDNGMIRLDLGSVQPIGQVNTWSSGRTRARQSFVLYGSRLASDPGWNVADAKAFTPIFAVDTRPQTCGEYEATSIRRSGGRPLGDYRWLVWVGSPVLGEIGGQNTTFEEVQVIRPASEKK